MHLNNLRAPAAAAALALLASTALAQTPAAGYGAPGAGHQRMQAIMQTRRAERQQELHTLLNIRPDQEAAFSAFEASMAPPPRQEREPERGGEAAMTTPQRLDRMLARMDEHMARMRSHVAATKAFYAALSPEQQRVFDVIGRMRHEGGHGWGPRGWGAEGGKRPMGRDGAPPPPPGV